ncbi:MAG: SsrA-binding protein SmpB [Candidatus Doudnabacteria bacterium]|nr:SsrA-binding protein SmpB [Candidatus Doudnabacteria bacterium]
MAKDLATNKRARHDYEFLEVLEAGLQLTGQEVKSAKAGNVSLKGAHVVITTNTTTGKPEAFLLNARISPYAPAGPLPSYDPERSRKLLLKRSQIDSLLGKKSQKGLTVVPVSLYSKGRLIKVKIALARGKTQFDKRQTMRERDDKRKMQRAMRGKA